MPTPAVPRGRRLSTGILPAAAIALGLSLAGCGNDDDGFSPQRNDVFAEDTFSHQFPAGLRTRLTLSGVSGDVEVGPGTDFRIEGTRRVGSFSAEDAEAGLSRLNVFVIDTGEAIEVETRQPSSDFRTYLVDYRVSVPAGVELEIADVNGTVSINGHTGSAVVAVVNGVVTAEMNVPVDGVVGLSTVNGLIDLAVPVATSATVNATVVNGSIGFENLPLQVQVSTSTRLQGTLGAGKATIGLSAVNGTILLRGV